MLGEPGDGVASFSETTVIDVVEPERAHTYRRFPLMSTTVSDYEILSAVGAQQHPQYTMDLVVVPEDINIGQRIARSTKESDMAFETRRVTVDDPLLQPLFEELAFEYRSRYGAKAKGELQRFPAAEFSPPHGVFLVLVDGDRAVAGGAFRRYDEETAELKRIWTSSAHRRRGLARRVLHELEKAAVDMRYSRLYLTTGPRQPEAKALYLAAGYSPLFDLTVDPETIGPLPFEKFVAAKAASRS